LPLHETIQTLHHNLSVLLVHYYNNPPLALATETTLNLYNSAITTVKMMESAENMCVDLEEWQSLQDPKSRRRIQNRIAQRVYRECY